MQNRFDFILSQISPHDQVLHVGCCGDEWLFDQVWANGQPLHKVLAEHVGKENLLGTDLNEKTSSRLREMGYPVIHADAESLDKLLGSWEEQVGRPWGFSPRFDVLVAGELIEHLTCPGAFLEAAKPFVSPQGKLLVTTPNAFGFWSWIAYGLRGVPEIHPEHTCWHSSRTLKNLLERHGWDVIHLEHVLAEPLSKRRFPWLKRIIYSVDRLKPILAAAGRLSVTTDNLS